jgi:hypothetical protein
VLELGEQEAKELKEAVKSSFSAPEPQILTRLRNALFNALHEMEN